MQLNVLFCRPVSGTLTASNTFETKFNEWSHQQSTKFHKWNVLLFDFSYFLLFMHFVFSVMELPQYNMQHFRFRLLVNMMKKKRHKSNNMNDKNNTQNFNTQKFSENKEKILYIFMMHKHYYYHLRKRPGLLLKLDIFLSSPTVWKIQATFNICT